MNDSKQSQFLSGRNPPLEVLKLADAISTFLSAYHATITPISDATLLHTLDFLLDELTETSLLLKSKRPV